MSDPIIKIENMNKWFGDFQVLKNINLEVEANKKIVVSTEIGSQGIPKKLLKSTILANSAEGFISAAKRVHDIDAKIIDEMKSNLIAEYSIQNTSLQMAKILFPSSDSSFLNKN